MLLSIVLLKNDGVLPLNRSKIRRLAVIGTNAVSAAMLEGNYNGRAARPVTILDGIKQLAGPGIEVTFAAGGPLALLKDGSNQPSREIRAGGLRCGAGHEPRQPSHQQRARQAGIRRAYERRSRSDQPDRSG